MPGGCTFLGTGDWIQGLCVTRFSNAVDLQGFLPGPWSKEQGKTCEKGFPFIRGRKRSVLCAPERAHGGHQVNSRLLHPFFRLTLDLGHPIKKLLHFMPEELKTAFSDWFQVQSLETVSCLSGQDLCD